MGELSGFLVHKNQPLLFGVLPVMFRATVCLKGELKDSISGYHSKHDGYRIFRLFEGSCEELGLPSNVGGGLSSANRE